MPVILSIVRYIVIPSLVLTLFWVFTPQASWKQGDTIQSWLSRATECTEEQIAGKEPGCSIDDVCWNCPIFSKVFDGLSQIGARFFLVISQSALTILAIGFFFLVGDENHTCCCGGKTPETRRVL